jgi:hypothetical protein
MLVPMIVLQTRNFENDIETVTYPETAAGHKPTPLQTVCNGWWRNRKASGRSTFFDCFGVS